MKKSSSRRRASTTRAPKDAVGAYLAEQPKVVRAALELLRKRIRAAVRGADEVISYQVPTFRYHGGLVAYAAHPEHCSLYIMSHATMAKHAADLEGYDTSGVTIRFQPDRPFPAALVKKLVKTRIEENTGRLQSKLGSTRKRSR